MPWSRWQCRKSLVGSCLSPLTTEDTALIAPDESLLPRASNTSHATSHLVMGRLTPGYSMTIFMVRYYILIFYLITKTLLIFHAIQSQMGLIRPGYSEFGKDFEQLQVLHNQKCLCPQSISRASPTFTLRTFRRITGAL